jgi:CsoR family transcriptional regulator, copper-sensing transcriptional repressor
MAGYTKNKGDLQIRLNRVEGQVRGVQRMVEEDRYCIDVLTQVNAIKAALDKVALALLDDHIGHCVADAVRSGKGEAKLEELTVAMSRFMGH